MAQSQKASLDDSEVSRRIAAKAAKDDFRHLLLDYGNSRNLRAITDIIRTFREQIVGEAKLRAPSLANGNPRDLTTYLRKNTNSRVLLGKTYTLEENKTKVKKNSVEKDNEWGWVGNPYSIARLAIAFLRSTLRFKADPTPFPFERLPPELRLIVYREALIGTIDSEEVHAQSVAVTPTRHRGKQLPFRIETSLPKGESMNINVGLLAASRLVNNEAIAVLYESRTFNFGTNVGAIAAFLSQKVPEQARQNLKGVAMEFHNKEEPDYCCLPPNFFPNYFWGKGPDNQAAWSKACAYISNQVKLKGLELTINVKVSAEFKSLKWVKDLVRIKGLKFLTLKVDQHSGSGRDVIRASYKEGSLTATDTCFNEHLVPLYDYLREEMLE